MSMILIYTVAVCICCVVAAELVDRSAAKRETAMKSTHDFELLQNFYDKALHAIESCTDAKQVESAERMVENFKSTLNDVERLDLYTKGVLAYCRRKGVTVHEEYIETHNRLYGQLVRSLESKRETLNVE